jgi:hypothetical protein
MIGEVAQLKTRDVFRDPCSGHCVQVDAVLTLVPSLISDAGLNGDVSNDEHSISSDVAADLAQDGDSMDSEREALNLVSVATPLRS